MYEALKIINLFSNFIVREDRTVVQAVPEDIATTKAYSVQV